MTPGITYFVELPGQPLRQLLERPGILDNLQRSGAAISMAMLDLSEARSEAIRALNERGIPVTAWLVLERGQGYWLTADNAGAAARRADQVLGWAKEHDLLFDAVGLDIEAPHEDSMALLRQGRRALRRLFLWRRSREAIRRAAHSYAGLIERIHAEGLRAETYQFPVILDERRARSSLLQRIFGIVDVAPDREVQMLYRSLLPPPLGDALVDAYGPDADAIGVGITGGGVEFVLDFLEMQLLDLSRLLTDLRRARRYTEHLYVFSLEGCVEAGFFEDLCRADLSIPAEPATLAPLAPVARALFRTLLRTERIWDAVQGR